MNLLIKIGYQELYIRNCPDSLPEGLLRAIYITGGNLPDSTWQRYATDKAPIEIQVVKGIPEDVISEDEFKRRKESLLALKENGGDEDRCEATAD